MISVIIAALNEEKFLPDILEDLSDQTISNYEIIVCDGGSKDKTVDVAKSFDCKVLISDKKKQQYQQNLAVKISKYDVLLFLDADIRIPNKDFLRITYDEFTKRQLNVAAFYSKFQKRNIPLLISESLINLAFVFASINPAANGAGGIISTKTAHDKINGFDESAYAGYDHDYARRISKFGKYGVLKRPRTIMSSRRFEKEGFLKIWIKWAIFGIYISFGRLPKKKFIAYDMPGGGEYDQ